jgi:hypothetical protein
MIDDRIGEVRPVMVSVVGIVGLLLLTRTGTYHDASIRARQRDGGAGM